MEIKATLLPGQNGTNQLRLVKFRIGYGEPLLREQVKATGGRWDPEIKLWELPYAEAAKLRLLERIVEEWEVEILRRGDEVILRKKP